MKKLIELFKKYFKLVEGLAVVIVTALAKLLLPPYIAESSIEKDVNIPILCGLIMFFLIVLLIYFSSNWTQKKYLTTWLYASSGAFLIFFTLLCFYHPFRDARVAYNSLSQEWVVTGDHLLPGARVKWDSVQLANPSTRPSRQDIVESSGPVEAIYPHDEVEKNARQLVLFYVATVSSGGLFILLALQTFYCLERTKSRRR